MTEIFEQSEALWKGEISVYDHDPYEPLNEMVTIAPGIWFYKGYSNMIVRQTEDGLIMIDPGAPIKTTNREGASYTDAENKFDALRSVTQSQLQIAIYTHHHLDHIYGMKRYIEESRANGWSSPQIIAHKNLASLLDRNREMSFQGSILDAGQANYDPENNNHFHIENISPPTFLYKEHLDIDTGGAKAKISHDKGETEDHTWVFFPDTKVLCTGDLFTWSMPSSANPYEPYCCALDWAKALLKMASLRPEILVPGHGLLVMGEDRVRQALEDTATVLESIHEQTIAYMNKGATLDEVIHSIKVPEDLLNRAYLQPVYGDAEFMVRSTWMLYGGWYDGIPAHLKPASNKAQSEEIAGLAGGVDKLVARAEQLVAEGDLRLACHLANWASLAEPTDHDVIKATQRIYMNRAEAETSSVAHGVFARAVSNLEKDNFERPNGKA